MLKVLRSPWKDELLGLVSRAEVSIKIAAPFVKKDVCREVLSQKQGSVQVELVTAFKLASVHAGALDLEAMEDILGQQGLVRNLARLHAKIYLFDQKKAVVSSANLSSGGLLNNFEYGLLTDDEAVVQAIAQEFSAWAADQTVGLVRAEHLTKAKEILSNIKRIAPPRIPAFSFTHPEQNLLVEASDPLRASLRGWALDVFNCLHTMSKQEFSASDIYAFESDLKQKHPENNTVRDQIRKQLQELRDIGLVEFLDRGQYRKLWT
jgi:hypothetical protein